MTSRTLNGPNHRRVAGMHEFYADILPDDGWYCVFLASAKEYRWVDTVEELMAAVLAASDQTDVYFAPESFKFAGTRYKGRSQTDVLMLKCLRIDIDAGAEKLEKHGADKVYVDGHAALEALVAFSKELGLMFSHLVRSGTGLHVYYVLDKAIPPAEWLPLARSLHAFCVQHGLKVDPSVTTDTARVLRPLGSVHPCGKEVKLLKSTGKVYSVAQFVGIVGSSPVVHSEQPMAIQGSFGSADFDLIKSGCDVVAWASDPSNQNSVEEPLWRGLLGVVKYCADADDLAHVVSEHHRDYDRIATEKKLADWKTGPTTCEYFSRYKPDLCGGCRHVDGAAE